jgi:adenosylmethionine-8-amino-7-oxononanoate aminotransferase
MKYRIQRYTIQHLPRQEIERSQRCRAATKRNTYHGDTERTKSKSKPQPRGHRESKRALRSGEEKFDSNGKQRNSSRPEKNLIDSSTEQVLLQLVFPA